MRIFPILLFVFLLIALVHFATAQVTNLQVNSSSTSFTSESGGTVSWQYDIPTGDTAVCDMWIDVNGNGTVEPETDHLYQSFTQIDGSGGESSGPPDIDGTANGHVVFSARVGIAPTKMILKFTNHGTSMQVPGTITPLTSPAHTVSGKVTVPEGKSAQYIVVELHRNSSYNPSFWHGITDASGNYTIQMDADTAGSPWRVRLLYNPYEPATVAPEEVRTYVSGNPTGINFQIQEVAAKVTGIIEDENGQPLPGWMAFLMRTDAGVNRSAQADAYGRYATGVMASELNNFTWTIQAGNGNPITNTTLMAQSQLPAIQSGDSLYRRLVIYTVNSQIQGQIRINGSAPGSPVQIVAMNDDSAQSVTNADGSTGTFSLGVTNKISRYRIFPISLGPDATVSPVNAHPGDTGVMLNVTLTSIEKDIHDIPHAFALEQNYPNPFNPSTVVSSQLPVASNVRLVVYDVLGREVTVLVNERRAAGSYKDEFDGSRLASGVYFYRLTAGTFVSTKTMIVLK